MTEAQNNFSSDDNSEVRYAGFWVRLIAMFIDSLIFLIPGYFIGLFVTPGSGFYTLINFTLWIIYEAAFLSSSWQATIGKKILGLKVVNEDGQKISAGRAIGRTFAQVFSVLTFCIGYFMVGWNKKKRGLHDMIAGTYVIKF